MTRPENPQPPTQIAEITVEVGDEADEYGLTRLRLDREGQYEIEQRGGVEVKVREPLSGDARELLEEPVEELFGRAERIDWDRPFPPRPGIPDEAVVEWRLRGPGGEQTCRMWLRDAEGDPGVAPLFAVLRTLVERASRGQLFL
jgi:hypothetical protein